MADDPEIFYGAAMTVWLYHKRGDGHHNAFAQGLFEIDGCLQLG